MRARVVPSPAAIRAAMSLGATPDLPETAKVVVNQEYSDPRALRYKIGACPGYAGPRETPRSRLMSVRAGFLCVGAALLLAGCGLFDSSRWNGNDPDAVRLSLIHISEPTRQAE